jgi:hypothetical protein
MTTNNKRKDLSGYQKRKNKRLRELNISIMNHGQTTLSDFFTAIQMSHSSEVKVHRHAQLPLCWKQNMMDLKIQLLTTMKIALISLLSMTWHQVSKNRRQSLSKTDNNKQCFTNFTELERNCSV